MSSNLDALFHHQVSTVVLKKQTLSHMELDMERWLKVSCSDRRPDRQIDG